LKVTIPSHYPRYTMRRFPRRIYTSFVFKERLENDPANKSKINDWLS